MLNIKTKNSKNTISNKKGEKIMKKVIMTSVTIMIMVVALTGCSNPLREDKNHATVSVTISDGRSSVWQSVNGTNTSRSGKKWALENKSEIIIATGETAHITFKCDACGNEQEFDIDTPWADIISCDCPEKIDKKGNAKEYTAIEVLYYNQEDAKNEVKK